MRKENKGKINNSETSAVLIKKIAIHIFLLQLKICTKIRGIFMLKPPSPAPMWKKNKRKIREIDAFLLKKNSVQIFWRRQNFFTKSRLRAANLTKKLNSEEADPVIFLWKLGILSKVFSRRHIFTQIFILRKILKEAEEKKLDKDDRLSKLGTSKKEKKSS